MWYCCGKLRERSSDFSLPSPPRCLGFPRQLSGGFPPVPPGLLPASPGLPPAPPGFSFLLSFYCDFLDLDPDLAIDGGLEKVWAVKGEGHQYHSWCSYVEAFKILHRDLLYLGGAAITRATPLSCREHTERTATAATPPHLAENWVLFLFSGARHRKASVETSMGDLRFGLFSFVWFLFFHLCVCCGSCLLFMLVCVLCFVFKFSLFWVTVSTVFELLVSHKLYWPLWEWIQFHYLCPLSIVFCPAWQSEQIRDQV